MREKDKEREIKAVHDRVARNINREKGKLCRKKEKIKGVHDRLRSRRKSEERETRHISRLIYVSRKAGRSRKRVKLSLELFFLIFRSISLFIARN